MGEIRPHRPVLLILGVTHQHATALDWARDRAVEQFGAVTLESQPFSFTDTSFYTDSMGKDLCKTFLVFERLIEPAEIVDIKLKTNEWEAQYARLGRHEEQRPLNLDPGYISEAKLVLATTKDRDHRMYLDQGIYAEVTLYYQRRAWCHSRWTYPDYRRDTYHRFFAKCREQLRRQYRDLTS